MLTQKFSKDLAGEKSCFLPQNYPGEFLHALKNALEKLSYHGEFLHALKNALNNIKGNGHVDPFVLMYTILICIKPYSAEHNLVNLLTKISVTVISY